MLFVNCLCVLLFVASNLALDSQDVPGGIKDVKVDDPEVNEFLRSSLNLFDSDSGVDNKFIVKKIISASHQVVAGSSWKIKAEIIVSDCPKSSTESLENCKEQPDAESKICDFSIWDRPWIKNGRETTVKCEKDESEKKYRSRRSPQVVGGVSTESADNPQALKHIKNTLPLLDKDSKFENKLKLKKIISASSQVVAGFKWIIKAEIVPSDCSKIDPKNVDDCGIQKDAELQECTFEIWEKVPQGHETTVKCDKDEKTYQYSARR